MWVKIFTNPLRMAHKLPVFCRYSFASQRRDIWISATNYSIKKSAEHRSERYMKKAIDLLNGSKKSKQRHWTLSMPSGIESGQSSVGQIRQNPRRAKQLSVVFHKYITSLISSGEVCPELHNRGFQILKIQVPPDLGAVQVHWISSGGENDVAITGLLPKCAADLRSSLIGLRLTGTVPPIQFCKDTRTAELHRVEELLKIADMGPDFEPSEVSDVEDEVALPATSINREAFNMEIQNVAKHFGGYSGYKSNDADFENTNSGAVETATQPDERTPDVSGDFNPTGAIGDQSLDASSVINELSELKLRSDLYGVQHNELVQKILSAKNKLNHRSTQTGHDETKEATLDKSVDFQNETKTQKQDLQRNTKKLMRRDERHVRNADNILSSRNFTDDKEADHDRFDDIVTGYRR